MPAIVLTGEEEFLIAKRVRALKENLVDPAWATFNFIRLENPDLKQVIDAAVTIPFGPGNRMVLIDRCSLFTKKRAGGDSEAGVKDKSAARLVDDFEASLKSIAPNTYVIFACPHNFDRSLKVSKAAEKLVQFETFEKVKFFPGASNSELIKFCNKEAHEYQAVIDDEAAFYLAECTEVDLRQISSEIQKAATYILPEQRITLEHVTLLSPHFSHVFALMEHWALRRREKVLESIYELQSRQIAATMVVGAMQTVLRKWIIYKTEYERMASVPAGGRDVRRKEVPLRDVANKIDRQMAFVIEKDLRKIKDLPLEFLVQKKQQLTELEHKVKTGQIPDAQALEIFFTR